MITFNEAMDIAAREKKPEWSERLGPFYVSPKGYEDDEWYLVQYGDARYWRDGNSEFVEGDAPILLVNKESGATKEVVYLENMDTIDAMTPVRAKKE